MMERRDFMKKALAVAALVVAGRAGSPFAEDKEDKTAAQRAKVFVTKRGGREAVARLLAPLGGISAFVKKGNRVVIKPNFSFSNLPEAASSTDPQLVRSLAVMCREAGAEKVSVVDNTIKSAKVCLERTGIKAAIKDLDGVTIVVPQKEPDFTEVEVPKGKALKQTRIAKVLLDSDVYISVPCAKSHSSTRVSFGLKGQMGLIQDRISFHWRFDIHQAIADLGTVMRPDLTILDAGRCLKTGGPGGPGTVVETGILAASTDPVAIDAYGTTLTEWQDEAIGPEDVEHIMRAAEHGLGLADLARIDVVQV
jgi:uncharacterized protein (DUF362 family)